MIECENAHLGSNTIDVPVTCRWILFDKTDQKTVSYNKKTCILNLVKEQLLHFTLGAIAMHWKDQFILDF